MLLCSELIFFYCLISFVYHCWWWTQLIITRILKRIMFVVVFRSLTIMLVAVSSYSILTTFPRLIGISMNYVNNSASTIHDYFFYRWAVNIIAPWNYCGNFFFYVSSGKQFRQELATLFRCRKRSHGAFVLNDVHLGKVL